MSNPFDISPECGDDCRIVMAKSLRWCAAEIDMGAGQPVAEHQVAEAGWPELQDGTNHVENPTVCHVDLEFWRGIFPAAFYFSLGTARFRISSKVNPAGSVTSLTER